MTAAALAAVVLGWLVAVSPPERAAAAQTFPEATETASERLQRYESIAEDVAAVALEGATEGQARRRAALLVAVAVFESGLAKDVDAPRCAAARVRRGGCDHGRAASLWQLHGVQPETRLAAAREALARLERSQTACRALPEAERLAAYAAGSCLSTAGRRASRARAELADRLARMGPP